MSKLVIPDIKPNLEDPTEYNKRVREIEESLLTKVEGSILLDEKKLVDILVKPDNYPVGTFIVPGELCHARKSSSRLNTLTCYMITLLSMGGRKRGWSFIIIAPSLESVDKRVRYTVKEVEEWS